MGGGNRLEFGLMKQLEFGRQNIKEEEAMQGGKSSRKLHNGRLESVDTHGILDAQVRPHKALQSTTTQS